MQVLNTQSSTLQSLNNVPKGTWIIQRRNLLQDAIAKT